MKALVLLCMMVPCVLGTGFSTFLPSDQFPVTGNLLNCAADEDRGYHLVGLNVTQPGEVFLPLTSGYSYPSLLENLALSTPANFLTISLIMNQLNLSSSLQKVLRPSDAEFDQVLAFPQRYDLTSTDYAQLQNICGEDVLGNVTDGIERNRDQGTFWDISENLDTEWTRIWNMTNQALHPLVTESSWRSDVLILFREMISVLSCRVAFRYADAGPTFIPRYFQGGYCLYRNCSIPDRNEFRCHADLSFEESRTLEAARWDCCWVYDTTSRIYKYECGFRKVRYPIVCDCDCRCADKAGI